MSYQIAQKIHACTDPHDPPAHPNDRARDVVDLLLQDLVESSGNPTTDDLRSAIEDVFASRAAEAQAVGAPSRAWPTTLTAHAHWEMSFTRAATSAGLTTDLVSAVERVDMWLGHLHGA